MKIRILLLLAVFAVPFFVSSLSRGQTLNYGDLKPYFILTHTDRYTFETGGQSPVKNQGGIGVCHLFSVASQLEQRRIKRTGRPLNLNMAYVVRHWWLMRIDETLRENAPVSSIRMGGNFVDDWLLFRKAGLMPAEAWANNPRYNDPRTYAKIDEYVRNIAGRAVWTAQKAPPAQKQQILSNARAEIEKLVNGFMGVPPSTFQYEGRTHTPVSFAAAYFPEIQGPYREYDIMNVREGAWRKTPPVPGGQRIAIPLNDAEKVVREALDSGQNVYLGYEHNGDFVDNKSGIMTIAGFSFPTGGGPLPRNARLEHRVFDGGHAVQVVGYDLDPRTGRVQKFKIKNSWGEQAGRAGYFHMYLDYFRAFAFSVVTF